MAQALGLTWQALVLEVTPTIARSALHWFGSDRAPESRIRIPSGLATPSRFQAIKSFSSGGNELSSSLTPGFLLQWSSESLRQGARATTPFPNGRSQRVASRVPLAGAGRGRFWNMFLC